MTNWNRTSKDSDDNEGSPRTQEKRKSRWTLPVEDEKLMKELVSVTVIFFAIIVSITLFNYELSFSQHFPFATTSSPIGDLARFYRECYHAPPLQTFDAPEMKPIDAIGDVTEQLQQFEVSLGEFDSMVSSLCQSGNNNSF